MGLEPDKTRRVTRTSPLPMPSISRSSRSNFRLTFDLSFGGRFSVALVLPTPNWSDAVGIFTRRTRACDQTFCDQTFCDQTFTFESIRDRFIKSTCVPTRPGMGPSTYPRRNRAWRLVISLNPFYPHILDSFVSVSNPCRADHQHTSRPGEPPGEGALANNRFDTFVPTLSYT